MCGDKVAGLREALVRLEKIDLAVDPDEYIDERVARQILLGRHEKLAKSSLMSANVEHAAGDGDRLVDVSHTLDLGDVVLPNVIVDKMARPSLVMVLALLPNRIDPIVPQVVNASD